MIDEQFYIYKKDVDWSVLREGFSIPVSTQVVFKERMNNYLKRGEKTVLNVIMDEQTYQVKLTNQAFDERKYPNHVDILQIRYSPQSPFAKKLREIFKSSFDYLQRKRINSNRIIRVPEEKREYLILYTSPLENTFFFEHITVLELLQIKHSISEIKEEDFEYLTNYKKFDDFSRIEKKSK